MCVDQWIATFRPLYSWSLSGGIDWLCINTSIIVVGGDWRISILASIACVVTQFVAAHCRRCQSGRVKDSWLKSRTKVKLSNDSFVYMKWWIFFRGRNRWQCDTTLLKMKIHKINRFPSYSSLIFSQIKYSYTKNRCPSAAKLSGRRECDSKARNLEYMLKQGHPTKVFRKIPVPQWKFSWLASY